MSMEYKPKYKPKLIESRIRKRHGYAPRPERWLTGPDPIEHDKYYAYSKHKAQARYRKEDYSITWEQWQQLWPHDLFVQRGRHANSLCLSMVDLNAGWHIWNVVVCERIEHLQRAKEFRDRS